MSATLRSGWPWLGAVTLALTIALAFEPIYRDVRGARSPEVAETMTAFSLRPQRAITLIANDYGHFDVAAHIDGVEVGLMTDTGATFVALNYETAQRLGYGDDTLRFTGRSATANGVVRVAPITLAELRIGDVAIANVLAVVGERGKMGQNLLGMSFINRLAGFELKAGRLVMRQ